MDMRFPSSFLLPFPLAAVLVYLEKNWRIAKSNGFRIISLEAAAETQETDK